MSLVNIHWQLIFQRGKTMEKRFKVMKWIMTLCLLLFLSGCSEKDAMVEKESVAGQKVRILDTLPTYGSERELQTAQTKRLAKKLINEGRIKDEYDLIFVDACQRDIPYRYAYFRNYAYKDESAMNVRYPYELYHVSVSEEGEITYYYTLLDYYVSTLDSGETVIYAGNEQDEVINEVTDLSTALKQESPFKYDTPELFPREKIYKSGVDLIRVMEKQWSAEQLAELQDPVTAVETLLRLRGGKGEIVDRSQQGSERVMLVRGGEGGSLGKAEILHNGEVFGLGERFGNEEGNDNVMVKYQFENGEEITYNMAFDGEYWMPMASKEKDDELYPELKGITDDQKRYEIICSLAAKSISMDDIKNALDNDESADGLLKAEVKGESFGIFCCGNAQIFTDWEKCYLIENVSVSTYALYDNCQTDSFDYDGDGQKEYAFAIQTLGGTGIWYEDLYIFDIENDHLNVRPFYYWDISIEPIKSILPEGWTSGPHVGYKLAKGQIILDRGVTPNRRLLGEMGYLHAKFMYHADGSYELTEPQFEMDDDMRTSMEKEKALLQYSASELKNVKRYYKGERSQERETSNFEVVIVAEDAKTDAAMYGICDEHRDVTVLRVKDDVFRLHLNDWSFDKNQRVLSGYDYDGDGEMEYLYYVIGEEGSCDQIHMFDIRDDKANVVNCHDYFTETELETILAEKYDSYDYSSGDYVISLKEHSIKCVQTVFGLDRNTGNYLEKALIRCEMKYGADGKFSIENPVLTMLVEE